MRFQSQAKRMSPEERRELQRNMVEEIKVQQKLIPMRSMRRKKS